jgi:UTP--glucose-1-phosphate uridylyltransferase
MNIKAVIAAAGYGTRFFPVTKVINKTMLPVLNRPVVDYIVDDCLVGGASDIAIVCLPSDEQIADYYTEKPHLKDYFFARGWEKKYAPLEELHTKANIHIIRQPIDGRYGTAIPPMLAEDFIGDSYFYSLTGDDIILRKQKDSLLADMIIAKQQCGADGVIAATRVSKDQVSRYGILATRQENTTLWLEGAIEKPAPEEAPSDLASISRFLLPPSYFEYLKGLGADPITGEYSNVEALLNFAKDYKVAVYVVDNGYYDCGDIKGWLEANKAALRLQYTS